MTDAELLAHASPALRRVRHGNYWRPAPSNPEGVFVPWKAVYRLVDAGALQWGNRCRSFVVRADNGH